jgi:hypothetical protein
MRTTNEIKKWLKTKLGVTARGNTSTGRGQWQGFWVPSDRFDEHGQRLIHTLRYSLPEFPIEFRRLCLQTIYGMDFVIHERVTAGNVSLYSVSMSAPQWDVVIAEWDKRHA